MPLTSVFLLLRTENEWAWGLEQENDLNPPMKLAKTKRLDLASSFEVYAAGGTCPLPLKAACLSLFHEGVFCPPWGERQCHLVTVNLQLPFCFPADILHVLTRKPPLINILVALCHLNVAQPLTPIKRGTRPREKQGRSQHRIVPALREVLSPWKTSSALSI